MALDMMVAMSLAFCHMVAAQPQQNKRRPPTEMGIKWVGPVDKFEALRLVWPPEGERF